MSEEKTQKEKVSGLQNTDFKYRVAQVLSGDYRQDDIVPVCHTSELIRSVGFSDEIIVITQKHIRNCLAPEETAKPGEHHHDLSIDFMDNLPKYIAEPAMILSSMTQPDSVVLVTDCKDKKDRPIIVALKNDGKGTVGGKVISCNVVTSTYGKDVFSNFLNNSLSNNGLLYWDEKKSRDLVVSAGLQLPGLLANHNSNVIIRRYNENVNTLSQENLDFSPDGYGTILNRPDGKPFAYSDPDGRQKLYEYTKGRNGDEVLSRTTVTFPDGRSEITMYNERGEVDGITRKDSSGRPTYNYSRKWNGEQREVSREFFETKYPYSPNYSDYSTPPCKSIHEKRHEITEGRYQDYHKYKEDWHEYDGRGSEYDKNGNVTLSKHNEYRDDGISPQKYYCREDRYEYDRYGNRTSSITKNRDGIEIVEEEYYSSGEWYNYYNLTPQDTDGEYQTPDKTHIYRRADGSMLVTEYDIGGEYLERDFSSDGKLTAYRDKSGKRYEGKDAQIEYLKSAGDKSLPFDEITATINAKIKNAYPEIKLSVGQEEKTQKENVAVPEASRPPFKPENIPQELKDLPNWVAYQRGEQKDSGHYKKKLYDCNKTKKNDHGAFDWAKSNDPTTWADFNKAVAFKNKIKRDGVSVALKGSGIMCIDIDECFGSDGKLTPHAAKMLELTGGTYAEKSSSGAGLHIFLQGSRPEGYKIQSDVFGLEVFDASDNRFISMTGDILDGSTRKILPASTELMSLLCAELIPQQKGAVQPRQSMTSSDNDVMARIEKSKRGAEFSALNRGELLYTKSDGSGAPDRSKCDYAYCNIVLFFNGGDVDQAVRMIKSSGLHRQDKPDKYYELTARNALSKLKSVYTKREYAGRSSGTMKSSNERG